MAEALVWIVDKQPLTGDPTWDRHIWRAGEVFVIFEDGHKWSRLEREEPRWRIVKFPGVPAAKLTQLLAPDLGYGDAEAEKASATLRRRAFKMDLVAAATKPEAGKEEAHALATVVAKDEIADPRIFGNEKVPVGVVFG